MKETQDCENMTLQIQFKTWKKETEDLFDFETKDVESSEFKITNDGSNHYLYVRNDKLSVTKNLFELKKTLVGKADSKIIGEISYKKNGNFQLCNSVSSYQLSSIDRNFIDRMWFVLPKNVPRLVEEGDIIKLGRVRLKVDKIVINSLPVLNTEGNYVSGFNYLKTNTTMQIVNSNNMGMNNIHNMLSNPNNIISMTNQNNNPNVSSVSLINISNICGNSIQTDNKTGNIISDKIYIKEDNLVTKQERPGSSHFTCRICFRGDSDTNDPLITPCKCSGSMSFIHYKCLKQCINIKISTKIGDSYICYIWKNFSCEICLAEYPKILKYKNTTYPLVDLNINYDQYIVFDYTLYDDTKRKSFRKGIIAVKLEDDEDITIGRTQTNTIKLKDISVSRNHCYLSRKDNSIYICDKGSKFGTLVLLKKPFTVCKEIKNKNMNDCYTDTSLCIASGKNFMEFKVIQSWNFFSNLFSSAMCCKYKSNAENEFVINIESLRDDNDIFNVKSKLNCNNLNDSYDDYVLNLDTIIRYNEVNYNNSFI